MILIVICYFVTLSNKTCFLSAALDFTIILDGKFYSEVNNHVYPNH
jgi:hypothetical protein